MAPQPVTIAVIPHERFGFARQSLNSVFEHSNPGTEIIYVDGGSPPLVRQFLEQKAARHGFRLISTERYVNPNEARNLALHHVRTKYVAFVDNDMLVGPGWLDSLVDCAEESGAWVVGSVCCQGKAEGGVISSAGGAADLTVRAGRRMFREHFCHLGQPHARLAPSLRREAVGQVGFQTALIRMAAVEALGPFDEQLLSGAQHTDFCLLTRVHGQAVYLEPGCVVTQVAPPPFEADDMEYFQLRWSDAWNRATIERFRLKWDLPAHDPGLLALAQRLDSHRRLALEPYRRILRVFGRSPAQWLERMLIAPFEQAASRRRIPPSETALDGIRKAA